MISNTAHSIFFDSHKLLYLLATSRYPLKLKVLDTLYIQATPILKVKSWVYTTQNGYLTLHRSTRIRKHSETIKEFILQCLDSPISNSCFISDVYFGNLIVKIDFEQTRRPSLFFAVVWK